MRIKSLEFRVNDENRSPEIVQWFAGYKEGAKETCMTLMFFDKHSDGYNARFIGARPLELDYEEPKLLWELMKYAQKVLDAKFELDDFCRMESYK